MRKLLAALLLLGLAAPATFARPQSSGADAGQKNADQDKKDKKDKKKKDKSAPKDEVNTEVFSQAVANDVLGQVRDGLEGHSSRMMLGAFDQDKMDGYLSFE